MADLDFAQSRAGRPCLRRIRELVGARPVVRHLRLGPRVGVARLRGRRADRLLAAAAGHGPSQLRRKTHRERRGILAVAAGADRLGEEFSKRLLQLGQADPVLWAFGSGDARLDRGEVELDDFAVVALSRARNPEKALRLKIVSQRFDVLGAASRLKKVLARLFVDGEEAHRRSVLGGHVGDGRAVGDRKGAGSLTVELDELADDLCLAEKLGHDEDEIGGGHSLRELAFHVNPDDVGCEEVDGLSQHPGLGLDAAHTPRDDSQPVDHRRVGIGPDQAVRVVDAILLHDSLRQVFEIDLMDDADARRDDLEPVERLHAPLEEFVSLAIARELDLHVLGQGIGAGPAVHLDGMIDDERDRDERLDQLRLLAEPRDGGTHGREVDEERHSRKVLKHDPCDDERDLGGSLRLRLPGRQSPHIVLFDSLSVQIAEQGFENDAKTDRQTGNPAKAGLLESRQGEQGAGPAARDRKSLANRKAVEGHIWCGRFNSDTLHFRVYRNVKETNS